MENNCRKLDNELIDKMRKIIETSESFLDNKSNNKLELSFVNEFPELAYDD